MMPIPRRLLATLALGSLVAACATEPAGPTAPPTRIVFFPEDSAHLDPAAQVVVAQAADAAKRQPGVPVRVLGFAPVGGTTVAYSRALTEARAQQVAGALQEAGVAAGRIVVVPRGPVPFEAVPVEARRVEIRIGT